MVDIRVIRANIVPPIKSLIVELTKEEALRIIDSSKRNRQDLAVHMNCPSWENSAARDIDFARMLEKVINNE